MPVLRPNPPAVTRGAAHAVSASRELFGGKRNRAAWVADLSCPPNGRAARHPRARSAAGRRRSTPSPPARGDGAGRDALTWAVDDAVARGWVASTAGADCGPDGLCGTSAPTVFTLTPAGRLGRGAGALSRRATLSPASSTMQIAEPTHQMQIASSRATST